MANWYRTGTIAVANGSTAVTGTLTAWSNQVKAGDELVVGILTGVEIASVNSDTSITLVQPWPHATQSAGTAYAIKRTSPDWSAAAALALDVRNTVSQLKNIVSTSSLTIGTGSKDFRIDPGLGSFVGLRVRMGEQSAPSTRYMEGVVTAQGNGILTINVDLVGGSGTYALWYGGIAGQPGFAAAGSIAPIANGGTGQSTAAAALTALLAGSTVPLLNGGTGTAAASAAAAFDALKQAATDTYVGAVELATTTEAETATATDRALTPSSMRRVKKVFIGTIADDTAVQIPVGSSRGTAVFVLENGTWAATCAWRTAAASNLVAMGEGSNPSTTVQAVGALTGTTGVDGNCTMSADLTTNSLYLENRTGASRGYCVEVSGTQ